jgi:hypothetical protein
MSLMLGLVSLTGVMTSRGLYAAGLQQMALRYGIAALASYGMFFILVRLWIAYTERPVDYVELEEEATSLDLDEMIEAGTDAGAALEEAQSLSSNTPVLHTAAMHEPNLAAGGDASPLKSTILGKFKLDLDDDEGMVLVILGLLVVVVCGGGAYLIVQAPEILSEAAFQAALSAGLVKSAKPMMKPDWMGSVLRKTWLPFVLFFAASVGAGWAIQLRCPGTTSFDQALASCKH